MEKYYYLVCVEAAVPEQANEVIAERLNYDEVLGFAYSVDYKIIASEPTRWWRVLDEDGKLWCETSSEDEARDSMFTQDPRGPWGKYAQTPIPGMKLQRLHQPQIDLATEWKDVE